MNFEFIKNRKIDKKSALKFNIFISIILWFSLFFLMILVWLAGGYFAFFDFKWFNSVTIIFYFIEFIFFLVVCKMLVLKFPKKGMTILSFAIVPFLLSLFFTSYFWYFITNLNIVSDIHF